MYASFFVNFTKNVSRSLFKSTRYLLVFIMAIFRLGAMFDRISGKVGGQSLANYRGYNSIKNITQRNKAPTPKQSIQRALTAFISGSWRNLSTAERQAWELSSIDYKWINRVGDEIVRNGYQTFCFVNQNLAVINKNILTSPPNYIPVIQPKINVIDTSNGVFEVQSNNATDIYEYPVFASANLSLGAKAFKGQLKKVGILSSLDLNNGIDLIPLIENTFGSLNFPNRIGVLIDPINKSTGNRGQDVQIIENIEKPLVLVVSVLSGDTITMPFVSGGVYGGSINWGDGANSNFASFNDPGASHTYTSDGEFVISVFGSFPRFDVNGNSITTKLIDIVQFGTNELSRLRLAGCLLLVEVNTLDVPTFSPLANCLSCLSNLPNVVRWDNLSRWDMSNVGNCTSFFSGFGLPLLDLSQWVLKSVTNLFRFSFNNDIIFDVSEWDVVNCISFRDAFNRNNAEIKGFENWTIKTSGNVNMRGVFDNSSYGGDLSAWDISNVNDMNQFGLSANFSNDDWDAMLNAWSGLPIPPGNITISINAIHSVNAQVAFDNLVNNFNWNITENV